MDNAFTGRAFPGFTTAELRAKIAAGVVDDRIVAEIDRREAVAAGNMSKASPGERLRASNADGYDWLINTFNKG